MDRLRRGEARAEVSPPHAHLVAGGGRGMPGLAQVLTERGFRVTGSEPYAGPAAERLRKLGARLHPAHCPRGAQFLVYGADVDREHPARLAAVRRGVAQGTVGQWLGALMRRSVGLAVAGGREASRVSAMIGWTLTRAGLDPTVVLGTRVPQLGGWARLGGGPHVVAEAIIEAGQLAPLAPRVAVLLGSEPSAGAEAGLRLQAARRFVESVPAEGFVLGLEPNAELAEAVRGASAPVEGVSLERGSAWWGADLREERGRFRFRAFHRDRFAVEVRLQVPGRRNVLSALAAVAACDRLAVPTTEIKQGLEEFSGLSRDFESRGSYRGVTLVDDASRDPASVLETLQIARQAFGPRQLWTVYAGTGDEPPEAEERSALSQALAEADRVLVAAGGAGTLVGDLIAAGVRARGVASLDAAVHELDRDLEPGDVLVTLGAGDVGTIADAFIRRLSRDRQGR
jgi:UDP-N-acetylmuramate--alanine ligase